MTELWFCNKIVLKFLEKEEVMVVQYKCPTCASDLAYDIEKDAMACPHCQLVVPIDINAVPDEKEYIVQV